MDFTDSDLDDISLCSTEVSEQDADKEYEVEKILASKTVDGIERYLVLWKNYPVERATWEPLSSFNDPSTIAEWRRVSTRQEKGLEPEFDWRTWDRDRAADEQASWERKRKREIKRRRLGWRRRPRGDSPTLDGFVVDDDEVSSLEACEALSEDELEVPQRARRLRRTDRASVSDSDTSEDSLMEKYRRKHALKMTAGASGKKSLRSEPTNDQLAGNSPSHSPKVKSAEKPSKVARSEKRKRVGSPGETLAGAAHDLSLKPSLKVKKQRLETGKPKVTFAPPKPGPSRMDKRGTFGANTSGQVKIFHSLSQANRAFKAGKNEPPPDMSKIELFAPGLQARGPSLSRRSSLQSPTTLNPPNFASLTNNAPSAWRQAIDGQQSSMMMTKAVPSGTYKIPKRKPTLPGTEFVQAPSDKAQADDGSLGDSSAVATQRREDLSSSNEIKSTKHVEFMDIDDPYPASSNMPLSRHMEIDTQQAEGPRIFTCSLELGPTASYVGQAKFSGLSTAFIDDLDNKPDCQSLWISKFYGQDYIKDFFAPYYGNPLQIAAIEIDLDEVQPLVNALNFLKGAGVILHKDFTMLVFLPSNNDLCRNTFKLPQLQTAAGKVKPALRVVVYPRLEDAPLPSKDKTKAHQGFIELPGISHWESDLRLALPSCMANTLNIDWDDILEVGKNKGKGDARFLFLYPPLAETEAEEYKEAVLSFGRTVIDLTDLSISPALRTTVMIHQSLRRHLHLLPQIDRLRKKTDHTFWLFGTKVEEGIVTERPQKIWVFGASIFLTPQLIVASPKAFRSVLEYQTIKQISTTVVLPSTWEHHLDNVLSQNPNEQLLIDIFDIKRKIQQKEIQILPVEIQPGCDELETYIDAFAFYQLENVTEYRRFCIGNTDLPQSRISENTGLYDNIEFYVPETLIEEFKKRK